MLTCRYSDTELTGVAEKCIKHAKQFTALRSDITRTVDFKMLELKSTRGLIWTIIIIYVHIYAFHNFM